MTVCTVPAHRSLLLKSASVRARGGGGGKSWLLGSLTIEVRPNNGDDDDDDIGVTEDEEALFLSQKEDNGESVM